VDRHSVSVAAAIQDGQGRLLAIRRADNGHWELPGGVLELGETIEAGVAREVAEETGLVVRPGPLTGVYKNMTRGIVALVLRCEVESGVPTGTEESAEARWLTPTEIEVLMAPAYAVRLLDAIRPGPPAVRAHDGHNLVD
jgi:ADP-ribose pyrophosphatase YjhB (NUDIX family)